MKKQGSWYRPPADNQLQRFCEKRKTQSLHLHPPLPLLLLSVFVSQLPSERKTEYCRAVCMLSYFSAQIGAEWK